jgi:hypothetical protein
MFYFAPIFFQNIYRLICPSYKQLAPSQMINNAPSGGRTPQFENFWARCWADIVMFFGGGVNVC